MRDALFDSSLDRALPARVLARKRMTWSAVDRALTPRPRVSPGLRLARLTALACAAVVGIAAIVVAPVQEHARTTRTVDRSPSPQVLLASPIEIVTGPRTRVELELLDDQELVDELAAAGYNRGVIRVGSEVWVVSR